MDAWEMLKLMKKYGKCEQCGNEIIGDGEGTLEVEEGCFKRTCKCGWNVEIEEN